MKAKLDKMVLLPFIGDPLALGKPPISDQDVSRDKRSRMAYYHTPILSDHPGKAAEVSPTTVTGRSFRYPEDHTAASIANATANGDNAARRRDLGLRPWRKILDHGAAGRTALRIEHS